MANKQVVVLFNKWDDSSGRNRKTILNKIITDCSNKNGSELEIYFKMGDMLFFNRLSAWFRVSYLIGVYLKEQLIGLKLFILASSGHKYVVEFVKTGGIMILLEILSLNHLPEISKLISLQLLEGICLYGNSYKEILCSAHGIRIISECLNWSSEAKTCYLCSRILLDLAQTSESNSVNVFKSLTALLNSSHHLTVQFSANALRELVHSTWSVPSQIVPNAVGALKSFHLEIQFELSQLLHQLAEYYREEIFDMILDILVKESCSKRIFQTEQSGETEPLYTQICAICGLIKTFMEEDDDNIELFLKKGLLKGLMDCIGNSDSWKLQKEAAYCIKFLCGKSTFVDMTVEKCIGEILYSMIINETDNFYANLTDVHLEVFRSSGMKLAGLKV